jgi:hypothetical protein
MQIVFKALFLKKSRPEKGCDGRPRPASTLDYSTIGDKLAREFFCEYIHHVSPPERDYGGPPRRPAAGQSA